MKERVKSTPYFPAYSLKDLDLSSHKVANTSSLSSQISRAFNRLKILPSGNSYLKRTSINKINIPVSIQSPENTWFTNYE